MTTVPSKEMRRGLLLIAKIIQNLANNVLFGAKEPYMYPLNPFLAQNIYKVTTFLREISVSSALTPASSLLFGLLTCFCSYSLGSACCARRSCGWRVLRLWIMRGSASILVRPLGSCQAETGLSGEKRLRSIPGRIDAWSFASVGAPEELDHEPRTTAVGCYLEQASDSGQHAAGILEVPEFYATKRVQEHRVLPDRPGCVRRRRKQGELFSQDQHLFAFAD